MSSVLEPNLEEPERQGSTSVAAVESIPVVSPKERKQLFKRVRAALEAFPAPPDPKLADQPQQALEFAIKAHGNQRRDSGEPYVTHPVAVAEMVAALIPDRATFIASLLHDVIEDSNTKKEDIAKRFGDEVASLVDGVTNVSRIRYGLTHEKQIENLRRLLVATAKDLRVIFIKLCDRLHNMRTLNSLAADKRRRICRSTLDIFAPLAHRLGLERIKNELEDLCLLYLHPEVYHDIKTRLDQKLAERQEYARKLQHTISDILATHGLDVEIKWRVKHFWSIYEKMNTDNKDLSEIHDLNGIRILTHNQNQCYAALGIIHGVWPQVQGRFKDYISRPKANDYRSLHTTVLGPDGRMLEIQIRTRNMHRVCEEGVAAHWRYKEQHGRSSRRLGDDAAWISQMSGVLQEMRDHSEWTESLKTDLFGDETYCYTPNGDIVRLPAKSCPIDFAYHIHTDLGDHCRGATVNGRYVPLSHRLKTGDVVEVETAKSSHPTPDWLNLVKSGKARSKIRNHLFDSNRETLIEQGRILLSRELHRINVDPNPFYSSKEFKGILESLNAETLEDLFALVGFGRIATKQVIARIIPSQPKERKTEHTVPGEKIKVSDIDDLLYRLARCCHPVPGEPIIGLVTRVRGISIHRDECVNVKNFEGDRARLIPLSWEDSGKTDSSTRVLIEADDRQQLLADVTNAISGAGINISNSISEVYGKNKARLSFAIQIRDINQLRRLAGLLIDIPGVERVSQMRGTKKSRLA